MVFEFIEQYFIQIHRFFVVVVVVCFWKILISFIDTEFLNWNKTPVLHEKSCPWRHWRNKFWRFINFWNTIEMLKQLI